MDLNYRESDEEVVKIEPNSSMSMDGQDMTFGLGTGLDQLPFGAIPSQQAVAQPAPRTPANPTGGKKVSGRVERAARIAELFDAGSPRVRLDHFVYKVDDNPVFDAARVFLDGECQNLVYCCDPKCAEKPTFKRFFSGMERRRAFNTLKPQRSKFYQHSDNNHGTYYRFLRGVGAGFYHCDSFSKRNEAKRSI